MVSQLLKYCFFSLNTAQNGGFSEHLSRVYYGFHVQTTILQTVTRKETGVQVLYVLVPGLVHILIACETPLPLG